MRRLVSNHQVIKLMFRAGPDYSNVGSKKLVFGWFAYVFYKKACKIHVITSNLGHSKNNIR